MKLKTLTVALVVASVGTLANAGAKQDALVNAPVAQYKASGEAEKYAKATVDFLVAVKKNDEKSKTDAITVIQADAGKVMLADYFLGQLYRTGKVAGHTDKEGMQLLKKSADSGVAEALHDYGMALYIGDAGAKKDQKKALDYFTKAAEKGVGNSYHNLCVYYEQGIAPIQKDTAKALTCFKNSATKYNVVQSYGKYAALKFADKNLDKLGEQEALKFASVGGSMGDAGSMALAATIMLTPKFNQPNVVGSFKNMQTSAELGYKPAYKALAAMYQNGVGVPVDKEIGAIWEQRSAQAK